MNYLITGATGYIGSQIAERLVAEGHTVHALYRSEGKLGSLATGTGQLLAGIVPKKGDLLDLPSLHAAAEGCDAVFHVAAFAKPWDKNPQTFYDYNHTGAVNVFEAALAAGARRVVFTSTAGTMSPSAKGLPSDEATPRSVDFFTDYDRSKAMAELAAERMCQQHGMEIVTVNPSRVYGPGLLSDSNGVTRMVRLWLDGRFRLLPGDGNGIGNYAYIDDVVEGHLLAMRHGRAGERYLLGGDNASFKEFFGKLETIAGKRRIMAHLPLPLLRGVASFMEWRAGITGTPPVLTPPWARRFSYNWELSIEKAKRELGYEPVSLRDGLVRTVRWLEDR
jgi:farnesol dehydrogenase